MDTQHIAETLGFNLRVLQRLEASKFDHILCGDFREAFKVEKGLNLKLQASLGYVFGLRDADILERTEVEEWIEVIRQASIHRYTSEDMLEILHAPFTIQDYTEWVDIYLS